MDDARGARELLLDFNARRGPLREALHSAIQDGRLPADTALPASPAWPPI